MYIIRLHIVKFYCFKRLWLVPVVRTAYLYGMIPISVRFMQIERAQESWQIHKACNIPYIHILSALINYLFFCKLKFCE